MDGARFDAFVRFIGTTTRRRSVQLLLGSGLAGLIGQADQSWTAAKKKKKKKCKAKKGLKKCGKKCIALESCCKDGDCGAQGACVSGTCACPNGAKSCRGACVPESGCCEDFECGAQSTCDTGTCSCGPTLKPCEGRCIPQDACCSDANCPAGTGTTCQNGRCDCPPGQQQSTGVCGVLPVCLSPSEGCDLQTQCCSGNCMPDPFPFGVCTCSQADRACKSHADCCAGLACIGFICRS